MKITAYYECEDKELEVEFDSPEELFAFEDRMDELQEERDEKERIEEEEEEEQERAEREERELECKKAVAKAKCGLRDVINKARDAGVSARDMAETIMSTIREMRDDADKKAGDRDSGCCGGKCSKDK